MQRILSLLPSATEIIYALDAPEMLAGVTHECDHPPDARTKPQLTSARITPDMPSAEIDELVRSQLDETGTLYALDLDLVRRLRPDLVLTQQLCTVCAVGYETVHKAMLSLDEPPEVVNVEPHNLDEVFASFVDVARRIGVEERGKRLAADLRARLTAIEQCEPLRVLFLEWLIPPFSAGHWVPELIEAAGGTPVLANPGTHSRGIAWERIAAETFDAVVVSCCGFSVDRALADVRACRELREILDDRPSVRLIVFDGNHYFSRPGPRLVESAELLAKALRGVAPEDTDASVERPYSLLQ